MLVKSLIVTGAAVLVVVVGVSSVSAALINAITAAAAAGGGGGGSGATDQSGSLPGAERAGPSEQAVGDIPPGYLRLYQGAARTCPGLSWTVLAAIGKIESDHGRSPLPGVRSGANPAGAMGPMQMLAASFAAYSGGIPAGGTTPPSPYNPHDAIHAAAHYLCAAGARDNRDLRAAIFAYNHADWYVTQVLTQATRYATTPVTHPPPAPTSAGAASGPPGSSAGRSPGRLGESVGAAVVAFARAQIGQPYVWGGDGPGEGGFDCSGLSAAAYASVRVGLPRTAHTQYLAGPLLPAGTPTQPGDLVFFGTPAKVGHVAIATGRGSEIIHAPDRGQRVSLADWRTLPDLLAVSRPAPQPAPHTG